MFLIGLPFVFAGFPFYSDQGLQRIGNETFGSSPLQNFSNTTNVNLCTQNSGTATSKPNMTINSSCTANYVHNLLAPVSGENKSCQFWAYGISDNGATTRLMMMGTSNWTGADEMVAFRVIGGTMMLRDENNGNTDALDGFNFDRTWNLLKITITGANRAVAYVNETQVAALALSGSIPNYFAFGTPQSNGGGVSALVSDFVCFVNSSKYNITSAAPPPPPQADDNITLRLVNDINGSPLNNFRVGITGQGVHFDMITTNGTINIRNVTNGFYNISFNSSEGGAYFNETYFNINVSGQNFTGRLYQALAIFNASEIVTNNTILNFGVNTTNLSTTMLNLSNSSGIAVLKLNAGTFSIKANVSGRIHNGSYISVTNLQTHYSTVYFGINNVSVTAKSSISSQFLTNFTVVVTSFDYPYQSVISTTNGNSSLILINGTYMLNVSSTGYSRKNLTVIFNITNFYPNITVLMDVLNSINFTIFDEFLGKPNKICCNSSVNLEIFSSVYSRNFTTTNGTLYIELLTASDYTIAYSSPNYRKRSYYLTLVNDTHYDIDLYLLSIGNGTLVTFTVQDNSAKPLEGGVIRLLRYYVDLFGYVQVASEKTDQNGKAIIDLEFNSAFYQTFTTYSHFSQLTSGTKIFSLTPTITVDTGTNPIIAENQIKNTTTLLNFNNDTQVFTYAFVNNLGTPLTGSLNVRRLGSSGMVTICDSSSTATSGSILCAINTSNITGEYIASGYLSFTGESKKMLTNQITEVTGYPKRALQIFQRQGVLIAIIMAGTFAGLGAVNPSISIVLFLVGLGAASWIGFSFMAFSTYIIIAIIGFMIIYKLRT